MAPNADAMTAGADVVAVREIEGARSFVISTETMTRPRNEKNVEYRLLRLENGLEAFLISDSETDKVRPIPSNAFPNADSRATDANPVSLSLSLQSAAAMDVRVGYLSDPEDLPGLAHFTEHMLFYSSEKYPKEDEYSKFISEHGGFCNAFTSAEDTNYHFDVNSSDFEPALDRFAQFFVAPRISKDGVGREMKAVDSENSKNLSSDLWRSMQLWRHVSKEDHPFHKFGTGNLETLKKTPEAKGVDTHTKMLEFYSTKYSANLMKLAVYARAPLDELENMVVTKFSKVKTLGKEEDKFEDVPFDADLHESKLLKVAPIRSIHQLDLQWLIPPETDVYKSTPCHYLSHLIGHEGDGSILKLLKDLKWANSLSAGPGPESYSSHSLFLISIELTEEGNAHVEEATKIVFQYLRMLRAQGIQRWIFDELRNIGETKFHFRDKQNAGYYVREVASGMQLYTPQDLLTAIHHVPQEYDEDHIRAILDCMIVDKVRIMWLSKAHKGQTKSVEPWYGTEFDSDALGAALVDGLKSCELHPKLHLPAPNEFIPTSFDLIERRDPAGEAEEDQSVAPRIIYRSEMSELWYKPDTRFETPKGQVLLSLMSPESYTTPEAAVCTNLLTKMLIDSMNEVTYYAEVAGLAYGISSTTVGLQIAFSGYSHKLLILAETVLKRLIAFKPDKERYFVLKEQMVKDFRNTKFDQPYQQAIYATSILLLQKKWHIDEYLDVLTSLTFEDFETFLRKVMLRMSNQTMVLGNLTEAQCISFVKSVEGLFTSVGTKATFASQVPEKRVISLPEGSNFSYSKAVGNEAEENGAVNIVFQVGTDSFKRNAVCQLWVQIAERSAFHALRSVEQIGYIVCVMGWDSHQVKNVYFILQSTSHHPISIDASVDKFLIELKKRLETMEEKELQDQKSGLAQSKLEKLKNLGQEGKRHWKEIDESMFVFDRQEKEVEELKGVTKADLLDFHDQYFLNREKRKKLSVYLVSQQAQSTGAPDPLDGVAPIEDVYKWKRGMPVYPAVTK